MLFQETWICNIKWLFPLPMLHYSIKFHENLADRPQQKYNRLHPLCGGVKCMHTMSVSLFMYWVTESAICLWAHGCWQSLASACVALSYHCFVYAFLWFTCISASKPHLQFTAASLVHCPNLCLLTLLFFCFPLCIVLACSYCIHLDWLVVWLYVLASGLGIG